MSRDLRTQIRDFAVEFERSLPPVDIASIPESDIHQERIPLDQPQPGLLARMPGWVVAMVSAVLVLVLIGGVGWVLSSSDDVAEQPTAPTTGEARTISDLDGRVVFAGITDGEVLGIHIHDFTTGETVAITAGDMYANAPVLSPDGTRIAFHAVPITGSNPDRDLENGNWDIYTINTDGSGLSRVTTSDQMDVFPDWSPDGSRIVFERVRASDDGRDIHTIRPDGTDEQQLTDRAGEDSAADWSPDGTQIAFATDRDTVPGTCERFGSEDCNLEIYLMDTNGGNLQRITNTEGVDGFPDWSPDGTQLVFHSNRSDPPWNFDIYTISIDGTALNQITHDPDDAPSERSYSDGQPSWSPDGRWIIYASDRGIHSGALEDELLANQLYITDTDGNQTEQLEAGIADSNWADWQD